MKRVWYILIWCPCLLSAQTSALQRDEAIDRLLESTVTAENESPDYTNTVESLEAWFENPLNINAATREDLENLLIPDEIQITELENYIRIHGPLLSIYELQLVKGWDRETIELLLPFIQVIPAKETHIRSFKNYLMAGKHELLWRYSQITEPQKGFEKDPGGNSHYLGIPQQFYARYRYSHSNKYSIGITAKNDRGESFFSGAYSTGFDFYSGHLLLKDIWKFRKIALGDFQFQAGQGITFWGGYAMRAGVASTSLMRYAQGINAYTSSNSFNYLRGCAYELAFKSFRWTGFFSYDGKDGNVDSVGIQSMVYTGLHRTLTEIAGKRTFTELVTGTYLQWKHKWIQVGGGVYYTHYNKTILPGSELYSIYTFYGQDQVNMGVDYRLRWGTVFLFGELGFDKNGHYAVLQGMETSCGNFRLAMAYRDYHKAYQNPHANAFSQSGTQNERGFYMGVAGPITKGLSFQSSIDVYQYPWLRYQVSLPSWGYEAMGKITWQINSSAEIYLRYKTSHDAANSKLDEGNTHQVIYINRHSLRLHTLIKAGKSVVFRTRIETVMINRPDDMFRWGFVAYQDINWQPVKWPLSISCRLAIFRTDGFDARIYAYENDLLYNFSVPFYYDKGMRWYVNINYKPLRGFTMGARIAQFYYPGATEIGSGYDAITGQTKTEVKLQIRYRFGNPHRKKEKTTEPTEAENL